MFDSKITELDFGQRMAVVLCHNMLPTPDIEI